MSTKAFSKTATALALAGAGCLAALSMWAQPMYDRIHVNLPYTITMQNKTLQPGDYTIQQLPSTTSSGRILLFYTNDGMKFETSAMTIPTLDNKTPTDTRLVLNNVGNDYYISKIWVQGKDYGYELPVPDSIKSREKERVTESTVAATYQPSASTEMTTATTTTTTASSQAAPPAETAAPANANSNNTADTANRPVDETAQATPPATEPATPPPASANSADRAVPDQTPAPQPDAATGSANRESMPPTAAGWLTMLLSGGTLSGAGLMLRRKR